MEFEAEFSEGGSRTNGMKDDGNRCHDLSRIDAHVPDYSQKELVAQADILCAAFSPTSDLHQN